MLDQDDVAPDVSGLVVEVVLVLVLVVVVVVVVVTVEANGTYCNLCQLLPFFRTPAGAANAGRLP